MSAGVLVFAVPPFAVLAGLAAICTGAVVQLSHGAVQLGVAGVAATVTGVGAVSATAADGVVALSAGAMEAWRKRFGGAPPTAGKAGLGYLYFALPISGEAETTFGKVLESMGLPLGEAVTMKLLNGTELNLSKVVWDANGQMLLGIRQNKSGEIEAVCAGEGGFRALQQAVVQTVRELAVATLGLQGFQVSKTVPIPDGGYKLELERTGEGKRREKVRLTYSARTGEMRIDSRGLLADGRPAMGTKCPDMSAFVKIFTRRKPGEEWKPELEPYDTPQPIQPHVNHQVPIPSPGPKTAEAFTATGRKSPPPTKQRGR